MPSKAFWTEHFEDAYRDARKKRREVIDRGLLLIAHQIRQELPTATAISVTSSLLTAVHDTDGTIWRSLDAATADKLSRPLLNDVRDTLLDMLDFARTGHPLLAAGWQEDPEQPQTYRAELPADPDQGQAQAQDTAPAVGDRPHGKPGEDAGTCAQCSRLLIWDGSGKRVNDEWGEYLCTGRPPGGTKSAVHVLDAPIASTPGAPTPERHPVNDFPPGVEFTSYGPDRFAPHLPFARRGYLFTVPSSWPDGIAAHTNSTSGEMAVYRARGEWEVRDIADSRRVWGSGPSRRVATGLALQEIARRRRIQAAETAEQPVG
ncbi:hypothetical protein [Streptomyces sp. NPDC012616]|uniref:hypothetical protein n=1 Tax=Streptomyces sp. NPDC012616 TaxID=3364840 RepID=UPI0036F027C3